MPLEGKEVETGDGTLCTKLASFGEDLGEFGRCIFGRQRLGGGEAAGLN